MYQKCIVICETLTSHIFSKVIFRLILNLIHFTYVKNKSGVRFYDEICWYRQQRETQCINVLGKIATTDTHPTFTYKLQLRAYCGQFLAQSFHMMVDCSLGVWSWVVLFWARMMLGGLGAMV